MFAGVIAGLGNAALGVMSKVLSQAAFEVIITKVLIYIMQKLVASTENTLDDEIVADIIKRLRK